MYRFKYSQDIMTDRRHGLLQRMSSNKRLSLNFYMPKTKEVSQLITSFISLLQILRFWKNTVNLKECVAVAALL